MTAAEFRATLKRLKLTQRALADILGVEKGTVNRWARGHMPVPKYASAYLDLPARLALHQPPGGIGLLGDGEVGRGVTGKSFGETPA